MQSPEQPDHHTSPASEAKARKHRFGAIGQFFADFTKPTQGGRPRVAARPSGTLLHDGEHSFSVLGGGTPQARPADCPFPVKNSPPIDRRDWRLLP